MREIEIELIDYYEILERIGSLMSEMKAKNPNPSPSKPNQTQKQAKNSVKQSQSQSQPQAAPKQKLISKTQYILDSPTKPQAQSSFSMATPTKQPANNPAPIQILSRQQKPAPTQPQQSPKPKQPVASSPGKKFTPVLPQSPQIGKSPATTGVPVLAGTNEAAPKASVLPIPFDFQSPKPVRNALLAQLLPMNDPISMLAASNPPDHKFRRLAKVNKLREILNGEEVPRFNDNYELIGYLETKCVQAGLEIGYSQFEQPEDGVYYGELILESFRVATGEARKKKKCKYTVFKTAYSILTSKSELAVKTVTGGKRRPDLRRIGAEVEFESELYLINSSIEVVSAASKQTTVVTKEEIGNMVSLNEMLRTMTLPKDVQPPGDQHEDDEDENRSQGSEKKSKIKQNLPNFCLFIPSMSIDEDINASNLDKFLHERNSISVLQNSCVKNKCNLDFEMKEKASRGSKSANKTRIPGDSLLAESDEDSRSPGQLETKIKCKCLINGVKIAAASSTNANDAKRAAALKAARCLFLLFPAIKAGNYHSVVNKPANESITTSFELLTPLAITSAPTSAEPKYFKISKEELFGGLIPPTVFETSTAGTTVGVISSPQFGLKMLKKMGWKGEGHGLGKHQQGMSEPVEYNMLINRFGLGYDEYSQELAELEQLDSMSKMALSDASAAPPPVPKRRTVRVGELVKNIRLLLTQFATSSSDNDLVFEKSLSAEDRKLVHREAHKLGLKTRSEGAESERFLVVRKKLSTSEIMEAAKRNGGQVGRYQIIQKNDI